MWILPVTGDDWVLLCKNFADVTAPLTSLVSPKNTFNTEECQCVLEAAKILLHSGPVPAASNFQNDSSMTVVKDYYCHREYAHLTINHTKYAS